MSRVLTRLLPVIFKYYFSDLFDVIKTETAALAVLPFDEVDPVAYS